MGNPSEHAPFPPSKMGLTLSCTGWKKYCESAGIEEGGSSEAAERGTRLHELTEQLFTKGSLTPEQIGKTTTEDLEAVDSAMGAAITALHNDDDSYEIRCELKVYPFMDTDLEKDCWGTADLVAYDPVKKHLVVLDYKFGYKYVVALANPQLKVYLLGALREFPNAVSADVVIVQPAHSDDPQVYSVDLSDLIDWRDSIVIPKLQQAKMDTYALRPGSWCDSHYCPARGQCKAQLGKTEELIEDFLVPVAEGQVPAVSAGISMEELAAIVDKASFIEEFLKGAKAQLKERIKSGEVSETKKLVAGRRSRSWTNNEDAEKFLKGQKLKLADRYTHKLLSPPQAEKLLKEKLNSVTRTKNIFDGLVLWKEGEPMLVDASDGRAAIVYGDSMDDFVDVGEVKDDVDLSDLM